MATDTPSPYEFAPEELRFLRGADSAPTVLAWRPAEDWGDVHERVARTDARTADLLLTLVRETAAARNDETRLLEVIQRFAFLAFPGATHHLLVARAHESDPLRTLIATSRDVGSTRVSLSRTIVDRVMRDGHALLFVQGEDRGGGSESIVLSRLETAIVAPLLGTSSPFGVLQLDVRRPAKGRFTQEDLDLLSVFASQVGLALEHLWLHQQQMRAFRSTIGALVHSLTLKDPDAARHSERVQKVSLALGHALDLSLVAHEVLSVASLLHDLGKQGISDEVLHKPGRLTTQEREAVDRHAEYTQTILDMIEYPAHLDDVPRIAAYHHEKLDGTGPLGIPGASLPLAARIIAVADVFDALVSERPYKKAMSPLGGMAIIERGSGKDFDPEVVSALRRVLPDVLSDVYGIVGGAQAGAAQDDDESLPRAA